MILSEKIEHIINQVREKHFPMNLNDGVTVTLSAASCVSDLYKQNIGAVFPSIDESKLFVIPEDRKERASDVRENFLKNGHRDFLILKKDGTPLGWFMGEQSDHATYYLRNSGLLPEFQNQGFATNFLPKFLAYLKDIGYERVTSQHKGDNPAVLVPMLKAGFILCGFEVDERWGPLFKMVRHLNDDRTKYFKERFI